jgi:2-iminobutanoate/2-iminopropanoate deaminase
MDEGAVLEGGDRHRARQDDLSRWPALKTENGKGADILHKGDFTAQCKYAFDKIKRVLEKNGAGLGDIVKMVSYITDVRYQPNFGRCRQETSGATRMPAHTLLTISQLAWPGMMVEVDVTAMVPLK